jgi:hypothetical protein
MQKVGREATGGQKKNRGFKEDGAIGLQVNAATSNDTFASFKNKNYLQALGNELLTLLSRRQVK